MGFPRPLLVPAPRRLRLGTGVIRLVSRRLPAIFDLETASSSIIRAAVRAAHRKQGPPRRKQLPSPAVRVALRPLEFSACPEAYRILIGDEAINLEAASPRGLYYAAGTLAALIRQYGLTLPHLLIEDAPHFAVRGFLLDVSRGKVPRRAALFALVERLASLKYNQLQLYIEHTFTFRRHPLLGRGHSPLTAADIRALGRHCRRHHIELVPCLQSLGHATHTLKHARYASLAESDFRGGWTLSPARRGAYRLLEELYDEFLPCFPPGKRFNACCDEPWDLGRGRSKSRAVVEGVDGVYVDHLLRVRRLAARHGRRPLYWADVLEKHPHHVVLLPADVGLLFWNYDAAPSAAALTNRLRRLTSPGGKRSIRGELWVCPGTSAWNSLFFRRDNAAANIFQTARAGHAVGASGFLLTDWGDNGHYNFATASLWSTAFAAECAWNAPKRRPNMARFDEAFAAAVLRAADPAWIGVLNNLGNLDAAFGVRVANHSPERWLLTGPPPPADDILGVAAMIAPFGRIPARNLRRSLARATRAAALLAPLRPADPALRVVRNEWLLSARLAAFACRRELLARGIPEPGDTPASLRAECRALSHRFEQLWLACNRESDLRRIREDFRRIAAAI
jgi:hexosaminidase